jgi:hypothetical protein
MSANTGCSKVVALVIGVFFCLFWSAVTLTFDVVWSIGVYRQIAASGYPTAPGEVTDSRVVVDGGGEDSMSTPKIAYAYWLGDKKYVSDRIRYGLMSSNDDNARRLVQQFPAGRQVRVYYSPNNPSDALLQPGIEGSDLFLPMFLTPFNAVMLAFWGAGLMGLRRWRRPEIAGGVPILDDGFEQRARLPRVAPSIVASIVLVAASFLLAFVVGIPCGFHPSLALMVGVWLALLAGAATIYFRAKLRVASGRYDLVIHQTSGALTLPQTFGRKVPQTLSADQVRSVIVETIEQRDSEGSRSLKYAPTLVWQAPHGAEHRDKLGEWTNSARAEAFAAWLREHLKSKATNLPALADRSAAGSV